MKRVQARSLERAFARQGIQLKRPKPGRPPVLALQQLQHALWQLVRLATIAVPACCRIWVRERLAVSIAKSAS